MASDKRRASRFRIDQMIEMSFGREESLRCRGIDLSESGILCRTDSAMEPGTRVFLLLSLSEGGDEEPISCEAAVARCTPADSGFDVGLSFVDVPTGIGNRLRKYLVRRPRA